MKKLMIGFLPLLLLVGCATATKDYWNQRVGKLTYNQVVAEFGQPLQVSSLPGGNRIGIWLVKPAAPASMSTTAVPSGAPPTASPSFDTTAPATQTPVFVPGHPDEYVRLTFSPSGKLIAWARETEFKK